MKVKTVVELPEGNYEFKAELTPEQHAFLIEFAVRELLRAGLIPFATAARDTAQLASIVPPSTEEPTIQ